MSHVSIFASFVRSRQVFSDVGNNFHLLDSDSLYELVDFDPVPPALIGGEEIQNPPMKKALDTPLVSLIDWLTFSMVSDDQTSVVEQIQFVVDSIVGWPKQVLIRSNSNLTGCQESWDFCGVDKETGLAVQLFKVGHMNKTDSSRSHFVFNIPGHCCSYFDFQKLSVLAEAVDAKITRCDVAVDDFSGKFSVHRAHCLYAKGAFMSNGKSHGSMPKFSKVSSGRGKESGGKTFYVGDRKNGKMLRVYEKGLQMQCEKNPKWVRWEVQFGNKDRILPWAILRDPSSFFLGSYAPIQKLFKDKLVNPTALYIKTDYDGKASRTLNELAKNLRIQYGKTLSVLVAKSANTAFSAFDIVRVLSREGAPSSLIMPLDDDDCMERLFAEDSKDRFGFRDFK